MYLFFDVSCLKIQQESTDVCLDDFIALWDTQRIKKETMRHKYWRGKGQENFLTSVGNQQSMTITSSSSSSSVMTTGSSDDAKELLLLLVRVAVAELAGCWGWLLTPLDPQLEVTLLPLPPPLPERFDCTVDAAAPCEQIFQKGVIKICNNTQEKKEVNLKTYRIWLFPLGRRNEYRMLPRPSFRYKWGAMTW